MDAPSGSGVASGGSVCTDIGCELCTATTRDIGVESAPTGICGERIITISGLCGVGAATAALGTICTVPVNCSGGPVPAGSWPAAIGDCGDGTTTAIASMDGPAGFGAPSGALDTINIACAFCRRITTGIGAAFERTGICGGRISITARPDGSGVGPAELVDICIACAYTSVGMGVIGASFANIGICGGATITITNTMAARDGSGDSSDASECTGTA